MDEKIREAFANEILAELEALGEMEIGSKEHAAAVESLTKLYHTGLDEVKADTDYEDKVSKREMEALKAEREKFDRWIRYGIELFGISLPVLVHISLFHEGLTFEQTGTVTSRFFLNLIQRFRPTK